MQNGMLDASVLDDPFFFDGDITDENLVRLQVARAEVLAGDRPYAEQILRGEAERDPRVFFGIFFRRRG